jgi:MFS family permease
MNEVTEKTRIYTKQFWLLCCSSLLFYASFNMLLPELPAFLTALGGAQHKGLIISLFTLTAMISRPFSGKLADKFGRVPVMIVGAAVCFLCSLVYPLISTVGAFFLLRLVHGFSTGFTPTGQSTYLADIIPSTKRGEALGLLMTASSFGGAAGPAVSSLIAQNFGIDVLFYCSSFLAVVSVIILIGIKETLYERQPFSFTMLTVKKEDLFEPLVLAPAIVMVLSTFSYGAVYTLLPDFGAFVGLKHNGILFAVFTLASLAVRLVAGKASDHYGRVPVLKISLVLVVISMLTIGLATTSGMLIAGATLYGFAYGSASPALLAWATDLSSEHHKGRGLASLYISMELGIGLGAFSSGLIYANNPSAFFAAFATCAALSTVAFIYLYVQVIFSSAASSNT